MEHVTAETPDGCRGSADERLGGATCRGSGSNFMDRLPGRYGGAVTGEPGTEAVRFRVLLTPMTRQFARCGSQADVASLDSARTHHQGRSRSGR